MEFGELSLLWLEVHQSEAHKFLLVRIPVTGIVVATDFYALSRRRSNGLGV